MKAIGHFIIPAFLFLGVSTHVDGRTIDPERGVALDCELAESDRSVLSKHILIFDFETGDTIHSGPDGKTNRLGAGGRMKDGSAYFTIDSKLDDLVAFHAMTDSGLASLQSQGKKYSGQCAEFWEFSEDSPTPKAFDISSANDCSKMSFALMQDSCSKHLEIPSQFLNPCIRAGFRIGWHSMTECIYAQVATSRPMTSAKRSKDRETETVNLSSSLRSQNSPNFYSKKSVEITFKEGFRESRYVGSVGRRGEITVKNPNTGERIRGTVDSNGSVRLKEDSGNTIKGEATSRGQGRVRGNDGTTYRIKPD